MYIRGLLIIALGGTMLAPNSDAQSTSDELPLEHVIVEATKLPLESSDVASSITVIDADRIKDELTQNIDDLVRYEPGIDVVDQGSRFGRSGISIRGIGGNRVHVEVDGVAVSDAFSIGSFSNAGRDFVDVDGIRQVEIVRGPASAVFGSDALGGVISFITKNPYDFLGDDDLYLDASTGFNEVDSSTVLSGTLAARHGLWSGSLRTTMRDGIELEKNMADPFDYDSLNLIGNLAYGALGEGGVQLTLERFEADSVTDVDSLERVQDFTAAFGFPYVIDTQTIKGDDQRVRTRWSIGQEWRDGKFGVNYLRWRAYRQDSKTIQDTFEARTSNIGGMVSSVERQRSFSFDQGLLGFEVNATSDFVIGNTSHQLVYGIEYESADTAQLRDGTEESLLTGEVSNVVGPDVFPLRDFPLSETTRTGIYLQDRLQVGAFTIVPGLRWDRFELKPNTDQIFMDDNPGVSPVALDESELTPKLGLLWDLSEHWQVFGQYSQGFRAPPVNDVNVGFTNLQFGYTALPNPDLRSESSKGVELGLRFRGRQSQFDVTAYQTRYDDFIESFSNVGFDPINQLVLFQSVNIDRVGIFGVEVRGVYDLSNFVDGLGLNFAAAFAEGEDRNSRLPINSIAPLNAVLGIDYQASNDRWGVSFITRAAESQDDLDTTGGPLLQPAGHVIFDAIAYFKPTAKSRIRAGLYNMTDHAYTAYLDVAGTSADGVNPDRFERPGRHFSIALDWSF